MAASCMLRRAIPPPAPIPPCRGVVGAILPQTSVAMFALFRVRIPRRHSGYPQCLAEIPNRTGGDSPAVGRATRLPQSLPATRRKKRRCVVCPGCVSPRAARSLRLPLSRICAGESLSAAQPPALLSSGVSPEETQAGEPPAPLPAAGGSPPGVAGISERHWGYCRGSGTWPLSMR